MGLFDFDVPARNWWNAAGVTLERARQEALDLDSLEGPAAINDGLYHAPSEVSDIARYTCRVSYDSPEVQANLNQVRISPERFCRDCGHQIRFARLPLTLWVKGIEDVLHTRSLNGFTSYSDVLRALNRTAHDNPLESGATFASWLINNQKVLSIEDAADLIRGSFIEEFERDLLRQSLRNYALNNPTLRPVQDSYYAWAEQAIAELRKVPGWMLSQPARRRNLDLYSKLASEVYALSESLLSFPAYLEPFFQRILVERPLVLNAKPEPALLENVATFYDPYATGPYSSLTAAWEAATRV